MGALGSLPTVADTVIKQFGKTATLTFLTGSTYNATTRENERETREQTVKGVKLKAGRYQKFSLQLVGGAEFGFMVSPVGLRAEPEPHKVTVTLSSVSHQVLHVEPVDIGDDGVAAYILHCKR